MRKIKTSKKLAVSAFALAAGAMMMFPGNVFAAAGDVVATTTVNGVVTGYFVSADAGDTKVNKEFTGIKKVTLGDGGTVNTQSGTDYIYFINGKSVGTKLVKLSADDKTALTTDAEYAYFVDGIFQDGFTGIVDNKFVIDGYVDATSKAVTGIAPNDASDAKAGYSYVKNGAVVSRTGIVKLGDADVNGVRTEVSTGYIDMVYLVNGKMDTAKERFVRNGQYLYYVREGAVVKDGDFTGAVRPYGNGTNTWYYLSTVSETKTDAGLYAALQTAKANEAAAKKALDKILVLTQETDKTTTQAKFVALQSGTDYTTNAAYAAVIDAAEDASTGEGTSDDGTAALAAGKAAASAKYTDYVTALSGAQAAYDAATSTTKFLVADATQTVKSTTIGYNPNSKTYWYVKNGVVDFSYNGIALNEGEDGLAIIADADKYIKFANGTVDTKSTGFADYMTTVNGNAVTYKFYVIDGKVVEANDYNPANGSYYYHSVRPAEDGNWYALTSFDGVLVADNHYDKNANVSYIGHNPNNGTQWYVKNGKVDFGYTGVVYKRANEYGEDTTYVMAVDGQIKDDYTGFGKYVYTDAEETFTTYYYFENGEWTRYLNDNGDVAGVRPFGDGTWVYVKNGVAEFSYTGVAKNPKNETLWIVENGKVNFDFTGTYSFIDDVTYEVKNGQILSTTVVETENK